MVTNCINDTYKYFSISLCDINLAKVLHISSTIVASIQYPRWFLYVFFICSSLHVGRRITAIAKNPLLLNVRQTFTNSGRNDI